MVILRDGLYCVGVPQVGVPFEVLRDGLNRIPGPRPDDGGDNFGLVFTSLPLIPNKGLLCFRNGRVKDALRSFIFVFSWSWSTWVYQYSCFRVNYFLTFHFF